MPKMMIELSWKSLVVLKNANITGLSSLLGSLQYSQGSEILKKLPYLVANTYGLNFIKIRGIWMFRVAEAPY